MASSPDDDRDDDERTDPETPTGLRRSLAAQANELEAAKRVAAEAMIMCASAQSESSAARVALAWWQRRFRAERIANIVLCVMLLALLAWDAWEKFGRYWF